MPVLRPPVMMGYKTKTKNRLIVEALVPLRVPLVTMASGIRGKKALTAVEAVRSPVLLVVTGFTTVMKKVSIVVVILALAAHRSDLDHHASHSKILSRLFLKTPLF